MYKCVNRSNTGNEINSSFLLDMENRDTGNIVVYTQGSTCLLKNLVVLPIRLARTQPPPLKERERVLFSQPLLPISLHARCVTNLLSSHMGTKKNPNTPARQDPSVKLFVFIRSPPYSKGFGIKTEASSESFKNAAKHL